MKDKSQRLLLLVFRMIEKNGKAPHEFPQP